MKRITLDTSCWIEWVDEGPGAADVGHARSLADTVIVPATCLYELYRWALRQGADEHATAETLAAMRACTVVALDERIALRAAETSSTLGLSFADATILATARLHDAPLVTLDADFEGLEYATVLRPART